MTNYCYNCMKPIEENSGICPHCGQAPFGVNPIHQLKTGTLLKNRYLIGKSLGQGGFGITYIGLDTTLGLRVAIKEYYPNGISNRNHEVADDVTQTSSSADLYNKGKFRFLQEAKTLARFNEEPGVVSVRDFFEANNTAYIVMEYLDGVTLKRFVESRGKIPADALFRAMNPIIHSLEKVHAQNVIHRDISPDNIMVLRDGSLKLLDFGSAREVGGDKSLSVMLKPGYAPEEQYRSKGKQGPWTDVYALCATMYFCLTGKRPEESVERVIDDTLQCPSAQGAKISLAQESVLLRGMSVHAADRYQSVDELVEALNMQMPPRIVDPPTPPTPRTSNHLVAALCGLLVVVGLIFGGIKIFGARETNPTVPEPAPTAMTSSEPIIPNIVDEESAHLKGVEQYETTAEPNFSEAYLQAKDETLYTWSEFLSMLRQNDPALPIIDGYSTIDYMPGIPQYTAWDVHDDDFISYWTYDFDGNGTQELVIDNINYYHTLAIYYFDGVKMRNIFNEMSLGYRCKLCRYNPYLKSFFVYGSSGATLGSVGVFQFSDDGYSVSQVRKYNYSGKPGSIDTLENRVGFTSVEQCEADLEYMFEQSEKPWYSLLDIEPEMKAVMEP